MRECALITGGGTGLGRAIALDLASKGIDTFIVGRRLEKLKEVSSRSDKINIIQEDISSVDGRDAVKEELADCKLKYLIHNAATVEPLKPLIEVSFDEWKKALSVNLEAPIFLTQALFPLLSPGARVLNISTELAHISMLGLGVYSITKAALLMAYMALKEEFIEHEIFFGSVQPGIVDTEMQEELRDEKHKATFKSQAVFTELKGNSLLLSPEKVSIQIIDMLLNMTDEKFGLKDWCIGPNAVE